VIAHLPIECATFLLNEKRSAIEQIENRLKVGIVILPSKHLETPAYDIERIKEKEAGENGKASYLQIKAEDITIPEFAQQVKPSAIKPAVKEFLHDSPAPVQNKSESASLIQRFWHKLVGSSAAPKATATQLPERTRPTDESQPGKSRDNRQGQGQSQERGRGRGRGRGRAQNGHNGHKEQVQTLEQGQAPKPKPEQNAESPRQNRPPRGQGRNVKRNLDTANMPATKAEDIKIEAAEVVEVIATAPEVSPPSVAGEREHPKRNNARRGPNRRRPRNPNYKKPETEGDSNASNEATGSSNDESRPAPRSYDGDFAERAERAERTERPESQTNAHSQANNGNQQLEAPKQAANPEPTPAPKPAEAAPRPVEVVKQETE